METSAPAEEADGLHAKLDAEDRGRGIRDAYTQLWEVVRLPAVRKLALVLLAFRLAVLPAEQAAPLKLLEKGVSKEALAGLVSRLHPRHTSNCIMSSSLQQVAWQACLELLACRWTLHHCCLWSTPVHIDTHTQYAASCT